MLRQASDPEIREATSRVAAASLAFSGPNGFGQKLKPPPVAPRRSSSSASSKPTFERSESDERSSNVVAPRTVCLAIFPDGFRR
jgi:hypothetical protein